MRASNWFQQADQAMIRAAARARAVAASTGTSIHIIKDGKIVEIFPAKEVRYPTSSKFLDEPELSVVREDTPPYGGQKP
jgi:apolipoprotein N-acyltransferase